MWCDPRYCKPTLYSDGTVAYEHRDGAPTLRPAAQVDAELTVRRTQLDDRGRVVSIGEVNGTITLTDTSSSATDGGDRLTISVDLDPMDMRMFAAQLVVMAEQVEATRNGGVFNALDLDGGAS